jgi:SAM-dependent methyltransferase
MMGMSITAEQEGEFYDRVYAEHLCLPDHALICNRCVLEGSLADPSQPVYERRRLYEVILRTLSAESAVDASVLDYGCGTGDWGLMLAGEGAHVTFLDLSPIAIQLVSRRAAASGVASSVRAIARDASDLSCFRNDEFDVIFASAAIHHTLKYTGAFAELMRVLRPGGRVVLAETYGNNEFLNWARRLRWTLANEAGEAGEGILFNDEHITLLRAQLEPLEVIPLSLLAMAKRLFRGRFTNPAVRLLLKGLETADAALLCALPFLRRYCGEVVVIGHKRVVAGGG